MRHNDIGENVTAIIEVRVTPARDQGFERTAERISRFDEVKSVYLMSGPYDLSVVIEGRNMMDVAQFVTKKLSTLDSVISTATHFILKKYKENGEILQQEEIIDDRMIISP